MDPSRTLRWGVGSRRRGKPAALLALLVVGSMMLAACGGDDGSGADDGAASDLELIEDGVLTVGLAQYMPYSGVEDGKLIGVDGEIVNAIAEGLDLEIKLNQSDWSGMIASVQQGPRSDLGIGAIAWTAERAGAGLMSDPTYFSPRALLTRAGETYPTFESLEGKVLGTVTGFGDIKAMKQVPGATAKVYPDSATVVAEVASGRVDVGFLDALVTKQAVQQDPTLGTNDLAVPTEEEIAEHPDFSFLVPYQAVFYSPNGATKLAEAINEQLKILYDDGTIAELLKKYGVDDPTSWIEVPQFSVDARRGVDRADDWIPPGGIAD